MTPDPIIQGWCPGALRPMMSGDGLVVRIRPKFGQISPSTAHEIAALSLKYGNGILDVTRRANLQIRGVSADTYPPLITALRQVGLIDDNVDIETRRNIIITPFRNEMTAKIAHDVTTILPRLPDLPGKFGFAIDTGDAAVLQDASCDMRIEIATNGALLLRLDGSTEGIITSLQELPDLILTAATWFMAHGVQNGRGRMAKLLATKPVLPRGLQGVLRPRPMADFPKAGPAHGGTILGCSYGMITADALCQIADLGRPLTMTPWRAIFIDTANKTPVIDGITTDPQDPILQIAACPGAPMCPQALGKPRDLANTLMPHIPKGVKIHVSGCAKGCAASHVTDVTLTATNSGYNLIYNGLASGSPRHSNLTLADIKSDPQRIFKG